MPIVLEGVRHVYKPGTPYQTVALRDIDLRIEDGQFVGLIGATGSGKSTLVQHLNGLLVPTSGRVVVNGLDTCGKDDRKLIRQRVSIVFQYPEHQLFEETVYRDVAFGPKNLGLGDREVDRRVREALGFVGLNPDVIGNRSPFSLSGGQMRRVAIAGVLAMKSNVLILDEPTAGLDPRGRNEILAQIARLHREAGTTVILVSHSMEDVARLANCILVMQAGQLVLEGTPRQVFSRAGELRSMGLDVPAVTQLMTILQERGLPVDTGVLDAEEASRNIATALGVARGA